jgi:hypothetical protein
MGIMPSLVAYLSKENPSLLYATLRKISGENVLTPLSSALANRIVAAAEYFNSQLTKDAPLHPSSSSRFGFFSKRGNALG